MELNEETDYVLSLFGRGTISFRKGAILRKRELHRVQGHNLSQSDKSHNIAALNFLVSPNLHQKDLAKAGGE